MSAYEIAVKGCDETTLVQLDLTEAEVALVERLAAGYWLLDVSEAEEGKLPRRLFVVTQARS